MAQRKAVKNVKPLRIETKVTRRSKIKYYCPVEVPLALIGGKWKSVILWHLFMDKNKIRFSDLKKRIPNLHERMLARTLRELETSGIVFREVYPEVPPHVEYGLTDQGYSLGPILESLCAWGRKHGWEPT